jgi:xanthine dehydrogenase accessory factor
MKDVVFQALAEAARLEEPVVLGIISGVKGSSPQSAGAKALFHKDGRITGTLGGGCLEAELQRRAIHSLRAGQPETFELVLDHDFGWDDGLICGGTVTGLLLPNAQQAGAPFWIELAERRSARVWGIKNDFSITSFPRNPEAVTGAASASATAPTGWRYQENLTPSCALWIAGAGHVAQAVAPLACQLDFDVTVFDDRPALVNHHIFPREIGLQSDTWERLLTLPLPAVPSCGLIVTRGHRHDALVLEHWIHRPFLFLGMIGSARKARTTFEHFAQEKLATPEELRRVACPVGVPIHSRTVMEIAVSIMAQYIAKRADFVAPAASPSFKPA